MGTWKLYCVPLVVLAMGSTGCAMDATDVADAEALADEPGLASAEESLTTEVVEESVSSSSDATRIYGSLFELCRVAPTHPLCRNPPDPRYRLRPPDRIYLYQPFCARRPDHPLCRGFRVRNPIGPPVCLSCPPGPIYRPGIPVERGRR